MLSQHEAFVVISMKPKGHYPFISHIKAFAGEHLSAKPIDISKTRE